MLKNNNCKRIFLQLLYPSLLVLIVGVVFSQSCTYPFLESFDDNVRITGNFPRFKLTFDNIFFWAKQPYYCLYIPVTMYSFMLDYAVWGSNAVGYHLQNIFWHIVAVLGVFYCFRHFKIKPYWAFLFAAIYAVHPQRVESVAWLTERKDVLCGAFYFWSIFCYMKSRPDKVFPVLPFIFFLLSFLAKPMAISLPFIFLCYEVYRQQKIMVWKNLFKLWPYFATSLALYFVNSRMSMYHEWEYNFFTHLLIVAHNYIWFPLTTLCPFELCPMYPRVYPDASTLLITILGWVVLLVSFAWLWIKNRRNFLYIIAPVVMAYTFAVLPVVGVVRHDFFDYADRYSYMPAFFIWLAVAGFVQFSLRNAENKHSGAPRLRIIYLAAAAVYLGIMTYRTIQYQPVWKSYQSIVMASANRPKANLRVLRTLSLIYFNEGDYAKAWQVSERIIKNSPVEYPGSRFNALGIQATILYRLGKYRETLAMIDSTLKEMKNTRVPGSDWTLASFYPIAADCCIKTGNPGRAVYFYDAAINYWRKQRPEGCYQFYFYSGMRDSLMGNLESAKVNFEKTLEFDPEFKQAAVNLKRVEEVLEKNITQKNK